MMTTTGASPAVRARGTGSTAEVQAAVPNPRWRYAATSARRSASSAGWLKVCPAASRTSGRSSAWGTRAVPSKRTSATR